MPDPQRFPDPETSIARVLSHTADRSDGGFVYRSDLFALLTPVFESAARQSWPALLDERILAPLGMTMTVPGRKYAPLQNRLVSLARPYLVNGRETRMVALPSPECNTAYGLVSTVRDLVVWSQALDSGRLVRPSQAGRLFTEKKDQRGNDNPYGLGWFVSEVAGVRLHWHYGWRVPGYGAILVRVPRYGLTFVILANSDRIVSGATLAWGNPLRSIFVVEFVRRYLLAGRDGDPYPPIDPDWDEKEMERHLGGREDGGRHLYGEELMALGTLEAQRGDWKNALRLMRAAVTRFPSSPGLYDKGTVQTLHWQRQEFFLREAFRLAQVLDRRDPGDAQVMQELSLLARETGAGPEMVGRYDKRLLALPWASRGPGECLPQTRCRIPGSASPALVSCIPFWCGASPAGRKNRRGLDTLARHDFWLRPMSGRTNW